MKIKMLLSLVIGITFAITGFAGEALAQKAGGPEDPGACQTLPAPAAGPYLYGTFTAAYDRDQCAVSKPDCKFIQVHLTVFDAKRTKEHLYSFSTFLPMPTTTDPPKKVTLCTLAAEDLKKQFAKTACAVKVGEDFGFKGVPVLTALKIKTRDFCKGPDDSAQMISGSFTLRVVPMNVSK